MLTLSELNTMNANLDKALDVSVAPRKLAPARKPTVKVDLDKVPWAGFSRYAKLNPENPVDPARIEKALGDYGVQGTVKDIMNGPVITQYRVEMAPGTRISAVRGIEEDLSVALASQVRVEAPIKGSTLIGIEVPNRERETVGFLETYEKYDGNMTLPIVVGKDVTGKPAFIDLARAPHLLVAGQTGSGKSVFLHSVVMSMFCKACENEEPLDVFIIDPKQVEFVGFGGIIDQILSPASGLQYPKDAYKSVITKMDSVPSFFECVVANMDARYKSMKNYGVRNIEGLREHEDAPYIVIVVDEMADLIMTHGKEIESNIVRIAQLGRAAGIHLVLATQKPVVKVLTGLIKSNVPARVAFRVASNSDSRVILDNSGAEKLLGRGDMLYLGPDMQEPVRYHGAWLSDDDTSYVRTWVEEGIKK